MLPASYPLSSPPPTPTPTITTVHLGLTPHAAWLTTNLPAYSPLPLTLTTAPSSSLWPDLNNNLYDAIILHQIPANTTNWFNPIGVDALVLVTHPDNPLTSLTRTDAQTIFAARQTSWAPFGGPDAPINLLLQP
ncbi:MAG TPA: substrate-binding domain-containing protein, partial [Anaerolineae bacterium]|nr:substrate-binding domain-containing protein [Anaerolineae bacterium]